MKTRILTLLVASVFVIGSNVAPAKAGSDNEIIGTLIGAAFGGFVGSNVGKGKGQLAATAIGVLLGAGIGNSVATAPNRPRHITKTIYAPRPQVIYQPRRKPRVVYVERIVYIKQKPRYRTQHIVVIHKYGKKQRWQKRNRNSQRPVYYNRGSYKNTRYNPRRRHNS